MQIITDANGVATAQLAPGAYRGDILPVPTYDDPADLQFNVIAGQTTFLTVHLQKTLGGAQVTVKDLVTGLPISGVTIEITAIIPPSP